MGSMMDSVAISMFVFLFCLFLTKLLKSNSPQGLQDVTSTNPVISLPFALLLSSEHGNHIYSPGSMCPLRRSV